MFNFQFVLIRKLSKNFSNSIKREEPSSPINLKKAEIQHENYKKIIQTLIPNLFEVFNIIIIIN